MAKEAQSGIWPGKITFHQSPELLLGNVTLTMVSILKLALGSQIKRQMCVGT